MPRCKHCDQLFEPDDSDAIEGDEFCSSDCEEEYDGSDDEEEEGEDD